MGLWGWLIWFPKLDLGLLVEPGGPKLHETLGKCHLNVKQIMLARASLPAAETFRDAKIISTQTLLREFVLN